MEEKQVVCVHAFLFGGFVVERKNSMIPFDLSLHVCVRVCVCP